MKMGKSQRQEFSNTVIKNNTQYLQELSGKTEGSDNIVNQPQIRRQKLVSASMVCKLSIVFIMKNQDWINRID